jgi:hypothetical protein
MRLIYINEIGTDYKNEKQYEFIFSKSTEFDIESWLEIPASISTTPKSPDLEYIDLVGLLKNSDIVLDLVQNSDYFGVIDAVDGVISLGWEKFNIESENQRLTFNFGETLDSVSKKIKQRGFRLINEELNIETYETN